MAAFFFFDGIILLKNNNLLPFSQYADIIEVINPGPAVDINHPNVLLPLMSRPLPPNLPSFVSSQKFQKPSNSIPLTIGMYTTFAFIWLGLAASDNKLVKYISKRVAARLLLTEDLPSLPEISKKTKVAKKAEIELDAIVGASEDVALPQPKSNSTVITSSIVSTSEKKRVISTPVKNSQTKDDRVVSLPGRNSQVNTELDEEERKRSHSIQQPKSIHLASSISRQNSRKGEAGRSSVLEQKRVSIVEPKSSPRPSVKKQTPTSSISRMMSYITGQPNDELVFSNAALPIAVTQGDSLDDSVLSSLDSSPKKRSSIYQVADFLLPSPEIDSALIPRASVVRNADGNSIMSYSQNSETIEAPKQSQESELSLLIFSQI